MDADIRGLLLPVPTASDDKYTRGTVGFVTGSERYPGAALLGVSAAQATSVGFVRYLGPRRVGDLLLLSHPEVVVSETPETTGPAQCWVLGSGIPGLQDPQAQNAAKILELADVAVIDAGGLDLIQRAEATPVGHHLLTPHQGELCRLLNRLELGFWHPEKLDDPRQASAAVALAAEATGHTVLLKGSVTRIAAANGETIEVGPNSPWLATAGTGDVLAGLLGGIAAQNPAVAAANWLDIAALAIEVHSSAAELAAESGAVTASSVASAISQALRQRFPR
ncbi:MAG: NAD(P)H-hydrate dehydratase [Micrococcales bacterium]